MNYKINKGIIPWVFLTNLKASMEYIRISNGKLIIRNENFRNGRRTKQTSNTNSRK